MRITQKTIWDYDEFLTGICEAAKDDDLDFVLLLIAAKTDIERAGYRSHRNGRLHPVAPVF